MFNDPPPPPLPGAHHLRFTGLPYSPGSSVRLLRLFRLPSFACVCCVFTFVSISISISARCCSEGAGARLGVGVDRVPAGGSAGGQHARGGKYRRSVPVPWNLRRYIILVRCSLVLLIPLRLLLLLLVVQTERLFLCVMLLSWRRRRAVLPWPG